MNKVMTANKAIVTVRCLVYNHEPYLRKCLDGFVMQRTTFPFEVIVHDDASTDNSPEIIREYAEKYPEIIKPIYETENQFSKNDDSLSRIMEAHIHGKYVAICEGDDFWSDSHKLQKQFDFMEKHPEHSLCFHAHRFLYSDGSTRDIARFDHDVEVCPIQNIILGDGGYMATNSMFYRRECTLHYPQWALDAPVGDLPLMLILAAKGKVGYINEIMSYYRINSVGSWSSSFMGTRKEINHRRLIAKLFKDFDQWSDKKYHTYVYKAYCSQRRKYLRKKMKFFFHGLFHRNTNK